jgi:hypothetical protein
VDEQRHRRLRLLVKKLNRERKKQARKIDILCNDLIGAQRSFIKRLSTISFVANFCESIIGATDLKSLLYTAVRIIQSETDNAGALFVLKSDDHPSVPGGADFELHAFESSHSATFESGFPFDAAREELAECFSPELMDGICKSNKVCTLDDMFAMGLQGNLVGLSKISAVTIPLGLSGSSMGFMLLYRLSQKGLTAEEIERISAVTYGLSRAIASCRALSNL